MEVWGRVGSGDNISTADNEDKVFDKSDGRAGSTSGGGGERNESERHGRDWADGVCEDGEGR